jgi:hypothetical protein
MNRIVIILALAAAGSAAQARAVHTFTFDELPAGSRANQLPSPPELGASFFNAVFAPLIDPISGLPIPGTERWRVDAGAPDVLINDPITFGRPAAPSAPNALEALFQPVLITFPVSLLLNPDGFSLQMANGSFGFNGNLPGFEDISAQFYDNDGRLLARLPIDQTRQGLIVSGAPTAGSPVRSILIPAGAFYDNIRIDGVQVPSPGWAGLLAAGMLTRRRRR